MNSIINFIACYCNTSIISIGVWYMKSSDNMEEILRLVGAGSCITSVVTQSFMMLSLQEDRDFGWWIRSEYIFKGRNRLRFKQRTHKMTSNCIHYNLFQYSIMRSCKCKCSKVCNS